jgi:hypothetical protein
VYLVDYEQRNLVPWLATGVAHRAPLAINATVAGRVFRTGQATQAGDDVSVWVPLLDGVERLGVLELSPLRETDNSASASHDAIRWLASLTGHLVTIQAEAGDAMDAVRRTRSRSVAAELLWQLLPPLTYGCDRVVISGLLEPAYEVGGDVFDYAVNADVAHIAMFDAMGHSVDAGLIAAAALAAYRACRREARSIAETASVIDETLATQFGGERFATGFICQLNLETGRVLYLSAGHPEPLVVRDARVVRTLVDGRRLPFGMPDGLPDVASSVAQEWLEPGDAVVLHTDGITEARAPDGSMFGSDRLIDLLEREFASRQSAPEMLRQVVHAVLAHQDGLLQDDATLLVAHWTTEDKDEFTPA